MYHIDMHTYLPNVEVYRQHKNRIKVKQYNILLVNDVAARLNPWHKVKRFLKTPKSRVKVMVF